MQESQIIRLPKKYGSLVLTMTDEIAGIVFKSIFDDSKDLEGMAKVYSDLIKVDLWNLEKSATNGKKGWRPKKEKTGGYEKEKPGVIEKHNLKEREREREGEREGESKEKEKGVQGEENETETSVSVRGDATQEFWDPEINKILSYLQKAVGIDEFKESRQMQRRYAKHLLDLGKRIGLEQFSERLKSVLSDDFKAKNCNKLAYLYGEIKAFAHSPVVPQEPKGIRIHKI